MGYLGDVDDNYDDDAHGVVDHDDNHGNDSDLMIALLAIMLIIMLTDGDYVDYDDGAYDDDANDGECTYYEVDGDAEDDDYGDGIDNADHQYLRAVVTMLLMVATSTMLTVMVNSIPMTMMTKMRLMTMTVQVTVTLSMMSNRTWSDVGDDDHDDADIVVDASVNDVAIGIMLPSFEARSLRRASRSHAHTGWIWYLAGGGRRISADGPRTVHFSDRFSDGVTGPILDGSGSEFGPIWYHFLDLF